MFIFIFVYATGAGGAIAFTFHYVYIYMQLFDFPPYVRLIYIPLCLYLYWEFLKTLNWIVPIFTFHYVYIYIRMTYRITMT